MRRVEFTAAVLDECIRAQRQHNRLNSLHEAYAVIAEEVDELWDEVRKKRLDRDWANIRTELVQIAAMAMRTANELL